LCLRATAASPGDGPDHSPDAAGVETPGTTIRRCLCYINRRAFDSGLFRGFGDDGRPLQTEFLDHARALPPYTCEKFPSHVLRFVPRQYGCHSFVPGSGVFPNHPSSRVCTPRSRVSVSSPTLAASMREALPEHHSTGVIDANDVTHPCGLIDTPNAHRLCRGSRLPGGYGGPQDRHHAGAAKPC
jgi:hypothetical protein